MDTTLTNSPANQNTASPASQAFRILQVAFVAAPIIAGLDKYFHLLVNWDKYLPSVVARLSPIPGHQLMLVVGVIEIIAAVIVLVRPRVGAPPRCRACCAAPSESSKPPFERDSRMPDGLAPSLSSAHYKG